MRETDVIIIGAGLLGCFTARNLTRYDMDVTVLERESDVCRGISRANTGIIYSGYDTKPGSLKSELCIKANREFESLCDDLGVPFSRTGSLMVGYGPNADDVIRKKYEQGIENDVPGLRLMSGDEAEAMEPALAKGITSALYSETTGTVDPWDLCIAAYENAKNNGAEFVFGAEVTDVQRVSRERSDEEGTEVVKSGAEDVGSGTEDVWAGNKHAETGKGFIVVTPEETWRAKVVINAAGLYADKLREMSEEPLIRIFPKAADYMILDKPPAHKSDGGGDCADRTDRGDFTGHADSTQHTDRVGHIIFHETEDGKGLTIVPTVDGSLLLGPTRRKLPKGKAADQSFETEVDGIGELEKLCEEVVPGFDLSTRIRTFGSLRPRPYYVDLKDGEYVKNDEKINDVCILDEDGLLSLIGIRTPGMTIADELGRVIADRVAEITGKTDASDINKSFDPKREPIVRARDLSPEERAELISNDYDYGEVVCFCMDVTKAEIRQAIERGASDIEAVKRRTGAGFGKCQGSRCYKRVLDMLTKNSALS